MGRICVVNCGLPGDECACFREMMRETYADLLENQVAPDHEIDRIIHDAAQRGDLYEK